MGQHSQLNNILAELRQGVETLYGERLVRLILYGSQARGDADEYSDIDVMVVLSSDFDRHDEMRRTSQLIAALSLKYDTVISRKFISVHRFMDGEIGLINNIHREGIAI